MNSLCLSLLVLIYVFPLCFSSSSDLSWYNSCGQNFSCGNVSIGFPFWGGSSRPKECGFPDLELTCVGEIKTTIQIAKMDFYVLKIDESTNILQIARKDLTDGLCLQTFQNTTLDSSRFYYAFGSQNITVLYGCPPLSGSGDGFGDGGTGYPGQFTCRISGVKDTVSYFQSGAAGPNGCYASVVVPVLTSSEVLMGKGLSLGQAIDVGFEVNYKEQDDDAKLCSECGLSYGRCGFDVGKNNAACVCPDGSFGYSPCGIKSQIPPKAAIRGSSSSSSSGQFGGQGGYGGADISQLQNLASQFGEVSSTSTTDLAEYHMYISYDFMRGMSLEEKNNLDLCAWWRDREQTLPAMSAMAKDFLSIQVSSVASERAFSAAKRVLDEKRTNLASDTLRMCVCYKDWLDAAERRQGEINAESDNDSEGETSTETIE